MKRKPEDTISLHGLTLAPSQILHGMRVVPLLRKQVRGDLRLAVHELDGVAAVQLAKKRVYVADEPTPFLPHALFVEYGPDQRPLATFGAELGNHERRAHPGMRVLHRMVKRRTGTSFRFLPLHLAMEGLLARHFGGPDVMRAEFTQEFLRYGMQRAEAVTFAADPKLAQVLATFEIHVGQVGCLLFGGDDLICAFVVPHPDDYRMLHDSLLLDFFAEPILHYTGPLFGDYGQKLVQSLLDNTQAANLEQLRILHRSLRLRHTS